MVYGFEGTYTGRSEYEWNHPEEGATHKCMLFLKQAVELDDFIGAKEICERYGFGEVKDLRCGRLQTEALNTDLYRGFAPFYEGALSDGHTILFYPENSRGGDQAT